jgi:hypothetical protein
MRAAAVALLALGLAIPAAGAPPPRRASLQLVASKPAVVVLGTGFGARERVALTLRAPAGSRLVRVRATRAGSFRARFAGLRVDRCAGFSVTAVGSRGSRAVLQAAPACGKRKGPPKRALPVLPP